MPETYHVRIAKDDLVFSAGHFITFDGDTCERLHGHNYRVAAEIHGPLDENHYVIDFIALRDVLRAIIATLDHRMLLPTTHPEIHVTPDATHVDVTFRDKRWVFPREDCLLLPIPNTTTELLARTIGHRLREDLATSCKARPTKVRIEVDENFGQIGVWEGEGWTPPS